MLTEELLKDALQYGKAFTKLGMTAQYIPQLRDVNKYYLGVCHCFPELSRALIRGRPNGYAITNTYLPLRPVQ